LFDEALTALGKGYHHLARRRADVVGASGSGDIRDARYDGGVDVAVLVDLAGGQRAEAPILTPTHEDPHDVENVGEHLARLKVAEREHEGLGRAWQVADHAA